MQRKAYHSVTDVKSEGLDCRVAFFAAKQHNPTQYTGYIEDIVDRIAGQLAARHNCPCIVVVYSDVRMFDRQQRSYRQATSDAAMHELVVPAYEPAADYDEVRLQANTVE